MYFCVAKTWRYSSLARLLPPYVRKPCLPVNLLTIFLFLFHLYSCANIIAKLITETKPVAIIQN